MALGWLKKCFCCACFGGPNTKEVNPESLVVTDIVWFDIQIGRDYIGRIKLGLFTGVVPKTVKRFITLTLNKEDGQGYLGTQFHRIDKAFFIQGGKLISQNQNPQPTEKYWPDENFCIKHYGEGWLSMANAGKPNTNGTEFFITLRRMSVFDGENVVFGKVLSGMNVVRKISQVETYGYSPMKEIVITNCGHETVKKPFVVSTLDTLPKYINTADHYYN